MTAYCQIPPLFQKWIDMHFLYGMVHLVAVSSELRSRGSVHHAEYRYSSLCRMFSMHLPPVGHIYPGAFAAAHDSATIP